MRVVAYEVNGLAKSVLKVREVPDPQPGPGEVRVRIHFSSVNPTDVKRRFSESPQFGAFQVPHQDGSGVIDRVGQGVSIERVGQTVWVYHGAHRRKLGTAAEYICIAQEQAVSLPTQVPLQVGALISIPMMTAAHALHLGDDLFGKHVLVTGGAGAVGSAAISLARSAGAQVTATVSNGEKATIAQEAGAHLVLNYRSSDLGEELSSLGKGVDLVVDVAIGANLPKYVPYLLDQARIVSYSSDGPELATSVRPLMFANARLEFFVIYNLNQEQLERAVTTVSEAIASGIRPVLPVHEFSLEDCAAAHEFVEGHELGRAVLKVVDWS